MKFSYTARIILAIGICAVAVFMLYNSYTEKTGEEAAVNTQVALAQGTLPKLINEEEELQIQLKQLKNDLQQAESLANESRASFDRRVESIEYDTMLFQLAQERDLNIARLATSEPHNQETSLETLYNDAELELIYEDIDFEATDQGLEPTNFTLTFFEVEVEGKPIEAIPKTDREHKAYIDQTVANILDFINVLINREEFISATFAIVSFKIPEPLTTVELATMSEGDTSEEEIIRTIGTASATIRFTVYNYEGE